MSMSYELMMKNKTKIMYATIKGSLTESPEGVFSGFAYNNYLVTQEGFDYSKNFEIVLKTNTGDLSLTSYKIIIRSNSGSNPGISGLAIGIENKRLRIYIINSEGEYIANGSFGVSYFVDNTDYFFKFSQKIDNGIYTIKLEISTDGINWTTENSWTSSLPIRNSGQGIAFGGGGFSSTTQYWTGSIDLPNSYIKLGATKYNLQAVVGYTVVGSPTITDGVVSGFSSSNYLTLPSFSSNINSLEIVFKIVNVPTTITNNALIFSLNGDITFRSFVTSANKVQFSYKDINNTTRNCPSTNTISNNKYVKFLLNDNGVFLYFSSDGITWNLEYSREEKPIITQITYGRIGYLSNTYNVYDGSLDIGKSLIKTNNKLWFNGQQA